MMKKLIIGALLALTGSLAAVPAHAADSQVALTGTVKLEKTVVENGQSRVVLSEPDVVVPGDRLLFSTSYANNGAETVEQFVVTNPLPSAVVMAPDVVANAEVSVDAGASWGQLASLTVAGEDGSPRAAQASDVTHIRWTIPVIAPGASGQVKYYAIVR